MSVSDRCPHGARYGYTMACDVTACQDLGRLLARRERIATDVLKGMAASGRALWDANGPLLGDHHVRAVQWADALMAELDK